MRVRYQGFRDWHALRNFRRKHLIKVYLVLVVKIACFGKNLQAHNITVQEDVLWFIAVISAPTEPGVSAHSLPPDWKLWWRKGNLSIHGRSQYAPCGLVVCYEYGDVERATRTYQRFGLVHRGSQINVSSPATSHAWRSGSSLAKGRCFS